MFIEAMTSESTTEKSSSTINKHQSTIHKTDQTLPQIESNSPISFSEDPDRQLCYQLKTSRIYCLIISSTN